MNTFTQDSTAEVRDPNFLTALLSDPKFSFYSGVRVFECPGCKYRNAVTSDAIEKKRTFVVTGNGNVSSRFQCRITCGGEKNDHEKEPGYNWNMVGCRKKLSIDFADLCYLYNQEWEIVNRIDRRERYPEQLTDARRAMEDRNANKRILDTLCAELQKRS